MSELKKCPFCGNEPIQDYKAVYCRYCFMMDEPDVRVDIWNTRPIEDALQAKLDEKLEIIDEQAETIVNFAFDEQPLKAKLDIAIKAIKDFIERFDDEDDTCMDTTIYVIEGLREALAKLEEK